MSKQMNLRWVAVLLAAGALGGCYSQSRLSSDYGNATRQNFAGSIADPDARYTGDPQPGSNSDRVATAQRRYVAGRVIAPASTSTSSISTGGGGGGDAGGAAPPGP